MDAKPKAKGSWGIRLFIAILGIILGILLFWLLGFITKDIGDLPGPGFAEMRKKYVDSTVDEKQKLLSEQVEVTEKQIGAINREQRILRDSSKNLQNTINQLARAAGKFDSSVEITQIIKKSQAAFLEKQTKYEENNEKIFELTQQLNEKESDLAAVKKAIEKQEDAARKEYSGLRKKHRLKVAAIKLAVLLPIFIVVSILFLKRRSWAYRSIVWAAFIAAFVKIAFVVHEYFPREYFKYIAILVVIAIVLGILIRLIKRVVRPKKELLVKQYQQNYDKHVCPVCSKPIRTNQLAFSALSALRKKSSLVTEMQSETQQEYSCPSCGTKLYEKCQNCEGIRHSLLPYCLSCGAEKAGVFQE